MIHARHGRADTCIDMHLPTSCVAVLLAIFDTTVDKRSVPEPNVNVDIVPGCNLLRNQFAVANYTGPLACNLQGAGPGASNSSAPACVVSPLFVAA